MKTLLGTIIKKHSSLYLMCAKPLIPFYEKQGFSITQKGPAIMKVKQKIGNMLLNKKHQLVIMKR